MSSNPTFLDVRGQNCPFPVLKAKKAMKSLATGDLLVVETTDPLAALDIPAFCNEDGHALQKTDETETGHRFEIVKG